MYYVFSGMLGIAGIMVIIIMLDGRQRQNLPQRGTGHMNCLLSNEGYVAGNGSGGGSATGINSGTVDTALFGQNMYSEKGNDVDLKESLLAFDDGVDIN